MSTTAPLAALLTLLTLLAALASGGPAPPALLPGFTFAWTDSATEALLAFRFRPGKGPRRTITAVRIPGPRLTVTGFTVEPARDLLILRLRAARPGVVDVRRLVLESRYQPPTTLRPGAAEVVALSEVGGALRLGGWVSDDTLGLYAAFALVNSTPQAIVVRTLRYAPEPLSRGLLLLGSGPPQRFASWKEALLDRMAPAFAAFLQEHGRSPAFGRRPLRPTSLAFPPSPRLAARWRAPDHLDTPLAPGQALFVAITPAAFSSYVHDLAITSYPVVGYEIAGSCCHLEGLPAGFVHLPAAPPGGRSPAGDSRP